MKPILRWPSREVIFTDAYIQELTKRLFSFWHFKDYELSDVVQTRLKDTACSILETESIDLFYDKSKCCAIARIHV